MSPAQLPSRFHFCLLALLAATGVAGCAQLDHGGARPPITEHFASRIDYADRLDESYAYGYRPTRWRDWPVEWSVNAPTEELSEPQPPSEAHPSEAHPSEAHPSEAEPTPSPTSSAPTESASPTEPSATPPAAPPATPSEPDRENSPADPSPAPGPELDNNPFGPSSSRAPSSLHPTAVDASPTPARLEPAADEPRLLPQPTETSLNGNTLRWRGHATADSAPQPVRLTTWEEADEQPRSVALPGASREPPPLPPALRQRQRRFRF